MTAKKIENIYIPQALVDIIYDHCKRKNNKIYYDDETKEQKAYGLVGGIRINNNIEIKEISILKDNVRKISPYKEFMDDLMNKYAEPSITALDNRGWVASPLESCQILKKYQDDNIEWVGSYHMHRVAWENDKLRDTPTLLDKKMAENTQQIQFIISVVNPEKPIMKCFFEGNIEQEIPIEVR